MDESVTYDLTDRSENRYEAHPWSVGDPITQERIMAIENELMALSSENLVDLMNAVDLNTRIGDGDPSGNLTDWIRTVASTASEAKTNANTALGDAKQGRWAWDQIAAVTESILEQNGERTYTRSLLERFEDIEKEFIDQQDTLKHQVNILESTVAGAKTRTNLDQTRYTFDSLVDRLNNTDQEVQRIYSDVSTLKTNYTTASGGAGSLNARLQEDETDIGNLKEEISNAHFSQANHPGGDSQSAQAQYATLDERFETDERAIKALKTELTEAHESIALNKTGNNAYATISARFEGIEEELTSGNNNISSRIDTLTGNVNNLADNKVNKTDIANNLTTETTGKVLDATQGKILKDTIDNMDAAYKAADTALDTRLDAIDGGSALDTTNGTLSERVTELETTITTSDSGLSDRMTTAENDIDALEAALDTAETGVKARITALETTVDTSTTGLSDRMTAAESAISHAASGGDAGGLTERLTVVESDINTAQTGLKARVTALETTVDTTTTGLVDRVTTIEGDLNTASTGLKARVTSLEGKDTVVVPYDGEHSNFNEGTPTYANPTTTEDYLIADDEGKYFYWRYFGAVDGWQLISGAGGGGTGSSSGMFIPSLSVFEGDDALIPDENTDYFVGNNTIGYTHYRYIPSETPGENGTFVRILPKGLLIGAGVNVNGGLEAYTVENSSTNVFANFVAFKDVEANPVKENDVVVSTNLVFTDTNGETHTVNVQGGGGAGSNSSYTVRLKNALNNLILTVPKKEGYEATLRARVEIKDAGVIDTEFDQSHTTNAIIQYSESKNGPWTNFTTMPIYNNTEFSVNINSILSLGNKTYIRITAATTIDDEDMTSSLTYEVTQVEMSISAVNFNPAIVRTTNFNFSYRCMGSELTKILHFKIDGTDITGSPITTTLHNDIGQQTIPLTGLEIGMHSFQVYFTVDGIESNILNYYIIYNNDNTRLAPIVALAAEKNTITYGDDLKINYTVSTAGTETTDSVVLELYAIEDGSEVIYSSTTLERVINERVDTWRPVEYPESGTAYIRATAVHTVNGTDYTDIRTIQITINELETNYTLEPAGTANLVYSYNAYGRSNNDVGKEVYHYNYNALGNQAIEWTGNFNGFNWSGDGYVDGTTLTISGGATHTVNVPIFQNAYNNITLEDSEGINDITRHGRTIEIEYEVASATDLNDVIIDCMANVTNITVNGVNKRGGVGFQVTPQACYLLKSGSTVDTDNTGFILNESDIAASYLTPGMRIHLAFVIEPWSDTLAYDRSYHQSVNIYVNGEFANACPYVQGTDSFANSATLRIGSNSCIIKLYQIKMYNRGLTHKEILQNYKMAPAATRDKLTRFADNDILNADGYVDYEKARTKYTCLLLTGPEPIYTTTTNNETVLSNPTVSPYKGYPSPAGRKDKKTGEVVGKTESGVTLTKANPKNPLGYDTEFDLRSTIPTDQNIDVPAYIGARGAYASSNNVQGTSSQKYPVHNLKVYLAKWNNPKTTVTETEVQDGQEIPQDAETITRIYKQVPHEDDEGYDLVEVEEGEDTTGLTTETKTFIITSTTTPGEIKKVKYSLKGKDEHGDDIGSAESTLCWKADYMSTDHANTFNANIADGLFSDTLPGASWDSKHQNTVYGIRCLLFQKQGSQPYEFLGDGCLNNDKGNNKTYDLERESEDGKDPGNNTSSQKWEFTNNSDDLGYFKTDTIFKIVGEGTNAHIQALDAFESTYPDQGDLEDAQDIYKAAHNNEEDPSLNPNYNHLQILLTWLSKRANYWDASTDSNTGGTYNGTTYATERELKKAIFINEFTTHINMNHALTYYLFSEYIALCDNRVKNMFFRSDNIKNEKVRKLSDGNYIFEGNSNPNAEFFKNIETNRSDIDWEVGENHSSFAVWAPVLYDLDSCFGVENVGYLRVRYDANWDYTWNSAPQFNGYESRLWLQFADCFDNEIKAAALNLYDRADGLNYINFYRQQITGNLKNISPALSNQDMLIKFDKPWSEGFMNYSLAEPAMETPYYKYLQRGSRTAQKTAFMNMRSKLLSSKYGAKEFTNDSIKFRTGVPVGASGNIVGYDENENPIYGDGDLTQTQITVKANQVMYPGVAYGDNKAPTRSLANGGKVNANEPCVIQATSAVQGNDGIFICGASILTDIGDISAFRPYQIDVGAGVNLKRLIVGSNAAGYTNGNTDNFQNLNKCVLLEEVNIQNCSNISTLDLSNNPLIKKVYATGSGTTTIILPNGGVLDTIEYSAVTGNITILNQKNLSHFVYEGAQTNEYSSLTKLWIENCNKPIYNNQDEIIGYSCAVPIVDIINKHINGLTSGIRLVGLDVDLYRDASTQEEIDAALETTTLFLNTLVSDLAKGKYLDSDGAFTPGSTQRPYIQGKVHVTSIRNSLLAKLNEYYPNLVVYNTIDSNGAISNNIITEYEIKYYNYDGETLLYTDYRTGREHFIDPASNDPEDIDPITGKNRLWSICPPDGIPKKPDDEQYKYTFGSYDNGNYIRYSGWVKQYTTTNPVADDYPQGNTVFIASYPTTTTQRYTVNWYEEPTGTAIKSYPANYGVDISGYTQPEEDGSIHRVKVVDNVVKVFKGWDRPVGKLTGNMNVYALWETSTIDNGVQIADINMSTLNAADLAAIARLGSEAKRRILEDKLGNDPIMLQMGHDFNFSSGVTTYDLLNGATKYNFNYSTADAKIYDGAHGTLPEIRPLNVNSDWTLAIDYKFLLTQAQYNDGSEWVLASCYSNIDSSIQGFKLSLVKNTTQNAKDEYIRVMWGTSSITIDQLRIDPTATNISKQYSRSYRNVVVLRHRASNPTQLQVFYVAPASLNTQAPYSYINYNPAQPTSTTLTWENSITINTPLIFGGVYEDASALNPVIENNRITHRPARGIIYWAKFWDKDLGEKNCNALASWPHEKVPFFLSGYDNNTSPSRQILGNTNLTFVAAQGVGDRYLYPKLQTMDTIAAVPANYTGWRESIARKICNERIYKGVATEYQSIILNTTVYSVAMNTTAANVQEEGAIMTRSTLDYFYLPAEGEVNGGELSDKKGDEVESTWPRPWPWMKPTNIHNIYGFVEGSSNTLEIKSASNIYPFLYRFNGNYIKPTARIFNINVDPYNNGNTWTYNNDQIEVQSGDVWINNDIAYIYYTNAEIAEGIYVDEVTAGGGWKKADIWSLRTYNTTITFSEENRFELIQDNGALLTSTTNTYRTVGRILCPEFSI